MDIFKSPSDLSNCLNALKNKGKTIGFVPTMGALHDGHISLIKECKNKCDISVVSIFVNPTQFNNPDDLKNYPKTLENDLYKLSEVNCDYVFIPEVTDIYPEGISDEVKPVLNIEKFDTVMEGKYRPGHFNGVCIVVKRLFDIISPNMAFFGKKDFQQLAVIQYMVNELKIPVKIIGCETKRMKSGLALSSRNLLLSKTNQEKASFLYKQLLYAKNNYTKLSRKELEEKIKQRFSKTEGIELEYFEFCDSSSLASVREWNNHKSVTACVSAYLSGVRLIDNITLF